MSSSPPSPPNHVASPPPPTTTTASPRAAADPTIIMGGQLVKRPTTRYLWHKLWGRRTRRGSNSAGATPAVVKRRSSKYAVTSPISGSTPHGGRGGGDAGTMAEIETVRMLMSLPDKLVTSETQPQPMIDLHQSGLFDALVRALEDRSNTNVVLAALVAVPSLDPEDLVRLVQREVQAWRISSGTMFKGCLEHPTSPAVRAACATTLIELIPRVSEWAVNNDVVPNTEHDRIEAIQDINDWLMKLYRALADRCADDMNDQVAMSSFDALDRLFTLASSSSSTFTRASTRVVSYIRSYLSRFVARAAWTQTPSSVRVASRVLVIMCSSVAPIISDSTIATERHLLFHFLLTTLVPLTQHMSNLALTAQNCALDLIQPSFVPKHVRDRVQTIVCQNAMKSIPPQDWTLQMSATDIISRRAACGIVLRCTDSTSSRNLEAVAIVACTCARALTTTKALDCEVLWPRTQIWLCLVECAKLLIWSAEPFQSREMRKIFDDAKNEESRHALCAAMLHAASLPTTPPPILANVLVKARECVAWDNVGVERFHVGLTYTRMLGRLALFAPELLDPLQTPSNKSRFPSSSIRDLFIWSVDVANDAKKVDTPMPLAFLMSESVSMLGTSSLFMGVSSLCRVAERIPETRREQILEFFTLIKRAQDLSSLEMRKLGEATRRLNDSYAKQVHHRPIAPFVPQDLPTRSMEFFVDPFTQQGQLSGGSDPLYVRARAVARPESRRLTVTLRIFTNSTASLNVVLRVGVVGGLQQIQGSNSFEGNLAAGQSHEWKIEFIVLPSMETKSLSLVVSLPPPEGGTPLWYTTAPWILRPSLFFMQPPSTDVIVWSGDYHGQWISMDAFRHLWTGKGGQCTSRIFCECNVASGGILNAEWQANMCARLPQRLASNSQRCAGYVAKSWFGDVILVYVQASRNGLIGHQSNSNDVLFVEMRVVGGNAAMSLSSLREFVEQEVVMPHIRILWMGSTSWPGAWGTTSSSASSSGSVGPSPDLTDVGSLVWSVPSYAVEDFAEMRRPGSLRLMVGSASSSDVLEASVERWKMIKSKAQKQSGGVMTPSPATRV